MTTEPTIEERMDGAAYESGIGAVPHGWAASIAREYAEERAKPLLEMLDEALAYVPVCTTYPGLHEPESCVRCIAEAALAAERAHQERQGGR